MTEIPATKKYTRKQRTALSKLTPKQRRFVTLLPNADSNTQAAIDAGYGKGSNRDSAQVMASETLSKPMVQEALITLYDENKIKQVISRHLDSDKEMVSLKAAELGARTLAMLTDRQKVETKLESSIDTSRLTDEQLRDELLKRLKMSSQGISTQYRDIPDTVGERTVRST
jgi:phage terminase small subunit